MLKGRAKMRFCFEYIPTVEFRSRLKQLKSKKATGHDDFPPKVVKDSADSVAQPLSYIINLSLSTGIFPDKCKITILFPLYKGDASDNFENYRPMSIPPVMA